MHEWNYHDNDPVRGPNEWARQYPSVGQAQSPINIQVDYCDLQQYQQQQVNCCSCDKQLLIDSMQQQQREQLIYQKQKTKLNSRQNISNNHHRDHLDSTGGDDDDDERSYERSPSTSSTNSALSSSSGGEEQAMSQAIIKPKRVEILKTTNSSSSNNNSNKQQQQQQYKQTTIKDEQQQKKEKEKKKILQTTRYCATNKKIFLGYPRYLNSIKVRNTGHAWQIDMPEELAKHTLLCGPPFGDREYRLAQLHCHWGSQCDHGSEHLVNGRAYSAELHFVHWNCKEFHSFEEAARHKHGLAVLGVFIQALDGDEQNCNKHLEKIVKALPMINERPQAQVHMDDARLDLKKLFPTNRWLYAQYEGSLTTPPLSEVVDWIVFLQPIICSQRQIETFRQLRCSPSGEKLEKNCRPIQATNKRIVSIWTHSNGHH